jgi:hypothetical protein
MVEGRSLVVPLIIEGLPEAIDCLGRHWRRKREFHLTALAERLLEPCDERAWDRVIRVASGRPLGPVTAVGEFRQVSHPEQPELRTLIVLADCPGLEGLVGDISDAAGLDLPVPPAHVTLYSTDPAEGIGIVDQRELAERAPPLSGSDQAQVRRAIGW